MTDDTAVIAREITRNGSIQTYFTTRFMVDRELEDDCYRAYAYFRWVDDCIDEIAQTREERITFIDRQRDIVDQLYNGGRPNGLCTEENIIADLIQRHQDLTSGLHSFIDNFIAILKFDAQRKGQMISQDELDWYTERLGVSVTDCIQYFIHNGHNYPKAHNQYLAASAAHITHMLRDMSDDLANGFVNIPSEYVEQHKVDPADLETPAFRNWVRQRVELARAYFSDGKKYLDKLEVLRCKIAGYWYCARFEIILDAIERDNYILRTSYDKENKYLAWLRIASLSLRVSLRHLLQAFPPLSGDRSPRH
jgi:phytoene/squalene synthetase